MEHLFVTNGQPLYYSSHGDSRSTLVLLHGGGVDSSRLSWDACRDQLAARYRVVCPDLPGFGRSLPLTRPCSAAFLIDCVGELIEKEIAGPVSVVGLSLGGLVAMGCALQHPRLVRALVLVNSLGLFRRLAWSPVAWLGGKLPIAHVLFSRFASYSDLGARSALRLVLKRKPSAELTARVRGCLASSQRLATGWRSFLSEEAAVRGFKTCFEDRLGRIRVPVLQIHGGCDRLIPTWHGIQSQPLFSDSELEIIPGCGHWLPREEPDLFCKLVTGFLDARGGMRSALADASPVPPITSGRA